MAGEALRQRRAPGAGHQAGPWLHAEPRLRAGADPAGTRRRDRTQSRRGRRGKPEERRAVPLLQRIDQDSLFVPPRPAAASRPSAAGQRSRASQAPRPRIRFRPRRSSRSRCRRACASACRFWCRCGSSPRAWIAAAGRATWSQRELERALAAWVDALAARRAERRPCSGTTWQPAAPSCCSTASTRCAVSEARDGADVYPARAAPERPRRRAPALGAAGNRMLLTSRPYGLDEAGSPASGWRARRSNRCPSRCSSFSSPRWFHTLGKPELAGQLLDAIARPRRLAPLVENPLLLTAVCVLYDNGGRLPEDRYELYKSIVERRAAQPLPGRCPRARAGPAAAGGDRLRHARGRAGRATRQTPAAEISWIETERLLADFAEQNPAFERGRGRAGGAARGAAEPLGPAGAAAGRARRLLPSELPGVPGRPADRARQRSDLDRLFRDARRRSPEWRPTLLFLFAAQIANRDPEWGLDLLARLAREPEAAPRSQANPAPAVLIAEALELCLAKGYRIPETVADRFRGLAVGAIEDEIELKARQAWVSRSAGSATRASSTCATRAPMSTYRPEPILTARRARRSRSRPRSGSAATR